jgi:hypothetical protein
MRCRNVAAGSHAIDPAADPNCSQEAGGRIVPHAANGAERGGRKLLRAGVAIVVGIVALMFVVLYPAKAARSSGFKTPTGNLVCQVQASAVSGLWLTCTVRSETNERGRKFWTMSSFGRVLVGRCWCMNVSNDVPILDYGSSWRWRAVRCVSRFRGLTCSNGSGHGFFLSREKQQVF